MIYRLKYTMSVRGSLLNTGTPVEVVGAFNKKVIMYIKGVSGIDISRLVATSRIDDRNIYDKCNTGECVILTKMFLDKYCRKGSDVSDW